MSRCPVLYCLVRGLLIDAWSLSDLVSDLRLRGLSGGPVDDASTDAADSESDAEDCRAGSPASLSVLLVIRGSVSLSEECSGPDGGSESSELVESLSEWAAPALVGRVGGESGSSEGLGDSSSCVLDDVSESSRLLRWVPVLAVWWSVRVLVIWVAISELDVVGALVSEVCL